MLKFGFLLKTAIDFISSSQQLTLYVNFADFAAVAILYFWPAAPFELR